MYVWSGNPSVKLQLIDHLNYYSLHQGADGYVYAIEERSDHGILHRFHPILQQRDWGGAQAPKLPRGQNWKITEDKRGRIWLSRWHKLACFDPTINQVYSFQLEKKDELITLGIIDLLVDSDDNLWLGNMYSGLIRISKISELEEGDQPFFQQFLTDPNDPTSISTNLIQQIHQSADGTIWVATDGGLNRLLPNGQEFKRYLRNEEMVDDKILSITSDSAGRLWMGTISHGILSFDPVTDQFNNYTRQDGLYGEAMLLSSVLRDKDGSIWMGGQDGLQHFDPAVVSLPAVVYTPNLVWLSLEKFGVDTIQQERFPKTGHEPDDPVHLWPNQHGFTVDLATLKFQSPNSIRYHFQLEGFHDQWLPPRKTGRLTLSNLPPGSYRLLVAATDQQENWRSEHPPIYLRVHPPWYRSTLAYLVYVLSGLGIIGALYQGQLRQKLAEAERIRVEELAQEKLSWFHRIAHEFRTPLTIIGGAVDQLRGHATPDQYRNLQQIDQQNAYLDRQIGQIMQMASLQAEGPRFHPTSGDFVAFQRYLLQSFGSLAEEKNIGLDFSTSHPHLCFPFDEDCWRKISGNLLANALKFTPIGGRISLSISLSRTPLEQQINLVIADDGIGMSSSFQDEVFQPFAREHAMEPGTGIGLALTQELVQLIDGTLTLESSVGQGSTFSISFPVVEPIVMEQAETTISNATETGDLPTIVLAEDHPEVLAYLRYCLDSHYHLLTARNGEIAWELCQREIPDLVISDVIMPGITGFELLVQLRQTPATDHIPVILLTAKADEEAKLVCVQRGADVFLAKPFRREELLAYVRQLISSREQLRQKYLAGDFGAPSSPIPEDSFMQSVVAIVESQYEEESFSVEALAAAVHLSRVQLFRKIKALTGRTPTLFIRQIRLGKARESLRQTTLSVSEIAYASGFKDPAYFARVYKDEFGHPPSQEREK